MAFAFEPGESIKVGLQRMAWEELRVAVHQLSDSSLKRAEKVHRTRRYGKQLRSLFRLARYGLGNQFKVEDQWIRDTSRLTSNLRDAKTLFDTYVGLVGARKPTIEQISADEVLSELHRHRKTFLSDKKRVTRTLVTVRERLEHQQALIGNWSLRGKGLQILQAGLSATYQEARSTMKKAVDTANTTDFHEWRKHVKYHFHHCRMVAPIWPVMLNARANELDDLGGWLGKDHDLAVLIEHVRLLKESVSGRAIEETIGLASVKRVQLQATAINTGQRLFAEKSGMFTDRHLRYWGLWHR